MTVPVELRTLGGLYFGTNSKRLEVQMDYTGDVYLTRIDPLEGYFTGGQVVSIVGSWGRILPHELEIRFDNQLVTNIESRNDTHL